jgi:hypothetical protein
MSSIELPRHKTLATLVLLIGGGFVALGLWAMIQGESFLAVELSLIAIGGLIAARATHTLVSRAPRFRASAKGLWFGGGRTIPWGEVESVFDSNVRYYTPLGSARAPAISFRFHTRASLLKAPIAYWITAPFGVGDVNISVGGYAPPRVLVSQLEAMRRAAG